jgi:UDP-glucose 4-epimerase
MNNTPTVLVTGGAGFIGSQLTEILVRQGRRVRIFDNLRRARLDEIEPFLAEGSAELVEGDVRYRRSVDRAMKGVESVAHLAATAINKSVVDPAESIEINLSGSDNVFASAADHGVGRVVFASTASVYGEPDELPISENAPLSPQTPYCLSKLASEQLLRFYGQTTGLRWNILRFFNVYGPGQRSEAYYTSVVLTFIHRLLNGEPPIIDGDGEQTMDFVHVHDVARALALALECDDTGHVCNIGTGIQTSIAELARLLIEAVGADTEPAFRPRDVIVTRRAADIRCAAEVLGWEPQIGIKEGLAQVVDEVLGHR